MRNLLTNGEYKVISELEKHSNKDKLINISITPLLEVTKELNYKKPTIYVYMRSLENKGYIEWSRNYYVKLIKDYDK